MTDNEDSKPPKDDSHRSDVAPKSDGPSATHPAPGHKPGTDGVLVGDEKAAADEKDTTAAATTPNDPKKPEPLKSESGKASESSVDPKTRDTKTPKDPTPPKGPNAPKENAPKEKTPKGGKKGSGGRWLLALFILVLFAVPIAAGYGAWLVWETVQQQSAALEEQDAQLEELDQSLSSQSQTLDRQAQTLNNLPDLENFERNLERDLRRSLQQERSEQNQLLENLEQRVSRVDHRLSAIASTDREDWKLAEAEYLLRVANQRLVLERDTRNALALAQTADGILRDLDDSDLTPVRRALTSDIQALKLVDRVDREGLYLQLLALGEQVPELPLTEPLEARGPNSEPDLDETPVAGAWERIKQSFHNVMQRLSSHIRIRRHDEPIAAMADPREEFYLRQQLQLMIEQAQSALLRGEPDIFQSSLNRAATWMEQHYPENPKTFEVIRTFNELADTEINPELPDLNQALNLLERHVDQLQRLSPDFQSPRGGGDAENGNAQDENEGGESAQ